MDKFKYTVIPENQFDQMLSMEESFAKEIKSKLRFVKTLVCEGEDDILQPPSPALVTEEMINKSRWIHSKSKLEIGKEYDIISFPATCSWGHSFAVEKGDRQ